MAGKKKAAKKKRTNKPRRRTPHGPIELDLGLGHFLSFYSWAPDNLKANRERYGTPLPNVPRAGATIRHPNLKRPGHECWAGVHFDLPETEKLEGARWQVQSWEPLTLTPSLLCLECGDHGFIEQGRWRPA